ncbi:MAG: hypothetical protein GY750_20835 [Lentisphaerae bacterium]|nr:hypothetical protein [Lentisphaerota bacterium]
MDQISKQAKQIASEMNLTVGSVWGTKEATVYAFKALTGEIVKFNVNGVIEEKKEVVEVKKAKLSPKQSEILEILKKGDVEITMGGNFWGTTLTQNGENLDRLPVRSLYALQDKGYIEREDILSPYEAKDGDRIGTYKVK